MVDERGNLVLGPGNPAPLRKESLRIYFKYNRSLLSDLCLCGKEALLKYFKAVTSLGLTPGIIAVIQSFGSIINLHPHLHFLISEGGSDREGRFHSVCRFNDDLLREIFTREVLSLLLRKQLINLTLVQKILRWRHTGFHVHSKVRATSKQEAERVGKYMIRPILSLKRLSFDQAQGQVIYQYGKHSSKLERMDYLEFIVSSCKGGWRVDMGAYEAQLNQPPVTVCQDVTVAAGSDCTSNAFTDNGSFDPDGDMITLTQDPAGPYPIGETLVTLTVTDDHDNSDFCQATVTVVDNSDPIIESINATPNILWPPNHKMVSVTLTVLATDNCDSAPVSRIIAVSSNEPDNGLGDGDIAPDWEIIEDLIVDLRAERSGKGNGRVYTITVECTDTSGNSSTRNVDVVVPHSKTKKK